MKSLFSLEIRILIVSIILLFPNFLKAQFPTISYDDLYNYLSNPGTNGTVEHIILAGNKIMWHHGSDHNVRNKFELSAMYATNFVRKGDKITMIFYGDESDDDLVARIKNYRKLYPNVKAISFRSFKNKNEIIEYMKEERRGKPKIGSISFFSHSFEFGLNIGEKDPRRPENAPKDKDKRKIWYEDDPQHLYPQNFREYMDDAELRMIKRNLSNKLTIAIYGCHTTRLRYKYEKPKEEKYYFKTPSGEKRTNYVVEKVNEPVSIGFANIFNATVIGTSFSTVFQTIDEKTGKWRYIEDNKQFTPPQALRMASQNRENFHIVTPDLLYKNGKKTKIKLKARPYKIPTPKEMYTDIWGNIPKKDKEILKKDYETKLKVFAPLYQAYEKDFAKLDSETKKKYIEEMNYRRKRLMEYSQKEKSYYKGEKDKKWLLRWRYYYQIRIQRKQYELHIPMTTIKTVK